MTADTGRRVAAVTGAAGGRGAAVCARLAADGFAVACLDYRADLASEVAAGLSGARGYGMDVRDAGSVRAAAGRNCVCPGLIGTEMADRIRLDEEALHRWSATRPAQRMGTPAEIADAVSFLASDHASYLQGSVLMVDGGGTA